MKEALGSSETLVLTRPTRRKIPEDTILHSHRRENLKSDDWKKFLAVLICTYSFACKKENIIWWLERGGSVICGIQVMLSVMIKTKTNSMAFSPQANYTDWATRH
jgi:hypothetical protein